MPDDFRHNHYVPRWYQDRFLPAQCKQRELHYVHKEPRTVHDGRGRRIPLPEVERRTLRNCFAERDLYTLAFRDVSSTDLERLFFGQIDRNGRKAVNFWTSYDRTQYAGEVLEPLLIYLSTQRLRTPKGLDWLARQIGSHDPMATLAAVVRFRQVFGAIWSECIWQVADAGASPTKFIVSDHPVTLYNRDVSPSHQQSQGSGDPDVRLNGTHTIFPLSMERVLILTHRSWATNPYGPPTKLRPNPQLERDAIFNQMEVQVGRQLDEDEVRRINFIIKSRAYRFVAAAETEWLYPERHLSRKVKWSRLGDRYLLFPDPRELHHGGEIIIGFAGGRVNVPRCLRKDASRPRLRQEHPASSRQGSAPAFQGRVRPALRPQAPRPRLGSTRRGQRRNARAPPQLPQAEGQRGAERGRRQKVTQEREKGSEALAEGSWSSHLRGNPPPKIRGHR